MPDKARKKPVAISDITWVEPADYSAPGNDIEYSAKAKKKVLDQELGALTEGYRLGKLENEPNGPMLIGKRADGTYLDDGDSIAALPCPDYCGASIETSS